MILIRGDRAFKAGERGMQTPQFLQRIAAGDVSFDVIGRQAQRGIEIGDSIGESPRRTRRGAALEMRFGHRG